MKAMMKTMMIAFFLILVLLLASCSSETCKNSVTSETLNVSEKITSPQMKSKTYNQMRKDWEDQ